MGKRTGKPRPDLEPLVDVDEEGGLLEQDGEQEPIAALQQPREQKQRPFTRNPRRQQPPRGA